MIRKVTSSIITTLFGLIFLSFFTSCGKNNVGIGKTEDSGIPSQDIPYVSYYVVNNKTVSNVHYLTADNVQEFQLSKKNDTTSFQLQFSNQAVLSDNSHTNEWIFCESNYDVDGVDQFQFYCQWPTDSTEVLIIGKTYNLNEIRDSKPLSIAESNGFATYRHLHRDLSLVTSFSTLAAITDPQPQDSYLIINNLDNNTASGTFTLAFRCTANNFAATNYVNYVKGVFNKVPVVK